MPSFGQHEMLIASATTTKSKKGNPGVVISGTIEDEPVRATIWISEARAAWAKKELKQCGFDAESQDLQEIDDDPALLRGNSVLVNVVDNPGYGYKVEIVTNTAPNKEELAAANSLLRGGRTKSAEIPPPPATSPF